MAGSLISISPFMETLDVLIDIEHFSMLLRQRERSHFGSTARAFLPRNDVWSYAFVLVLFRRVGRSAHAADGASRSTADISSVSVYVCSNSK